MHGGIWQSVINYTIKYWEREWLNCEFYKSLFSFLLAIENDKRLTFFFILSPSLKEFLPKEYIKQRGAEKRIFQVRIGNLQNFLILLTPYPHLLVVRGLCM